MISMLFLATHIDHWANRWSKELNLVKDFNKNRSLPFFTVA